MAIKSLLALGLAGMLGCSSQQEEQMNFSGMAATNRYDIQKGECVSAIYFEMLCYNGLDEHGRIKAASIGAEKKEFLIEVQPGFLALVDEPNHAAFFTIHSVSDSHLDITVFEYKK